MPSTIRLHRVLKAPPECTHVALPGTSRGLLYAMHSPDFEVQVVPPLMFAAVGTGDSVLDEIGLYHDIIVAGHVGNA